MNRRHALAAGFCIVAWGCKPPEPAPRNLDPARPQPARDAATPSDAGDPAAPVSRLTPFGSRDALRAWMQARQARPLGQGAGDGSEGAVLGGLPPQPSPPTSAAASATSGAAPPSAPRTAIRASAQAAPLPGTGANPPGAAPDSNESITNNQVEGVDEGDIVKMHGEHLVVLRRGRLFSVRLGDAGLTPVSMVDAYGRGRRPGGWYDEMLVDGDTIVVIGYSYAASASEVGLFDIDASGTIRWRDTLFVRSSDYYSSRNYASRLVGHRLVMYMPVPLNDLGGDELTLPAVRHTPDGAWESVVDFAQLYKPVQSVGYAPVVHTVLSCDLARRGFACRAVGVVGPTGRNFYVSGSAVYLWVPSAIEPAGRRMIPGEPAGPPPSVLFRLPLEGSAIGAARVRGTPLDQFSFDERAERLRVLVRADGGGEGMWGAEGGGGDLGLLRLPVSSFTADIPTIRGAAYRGLPRAENGAGAMQNRFVGDHLLYGVGAGWRGPAALRATHPVQVFDLARDRSTRIEISHSVERLEPIGRDALVVGNEPGGLTFSAIALDETPVVVGRHTVRGASQGESRSHGFFFSPSGDREGTLGLPVTVGDDGGGWSRLRNVSSSVLFLGVNGLRFRELGSLRSGTGAAVDDHCVASCADWYGNARPIFWRGRVFALMGYELVEGALEPATRDAALLARFRGGMSLPWPQGVRPATIRERRRVDFFRALLDSDRDRSGNVFNQLGD
jgi:hypothetical protein